MNSRIDSSLLKLIPLSTHFNLEDTYIHTYIRWFNNPLVAKYLLPTLPKTYDSIAAMLTNWVESPKKDYYFIYFRDTLIGHIGLTYLTYLPNKNPYKAEIGLVIGEPSYWGKSIGYFAIMNLRSIIKDSDLKYIIARIHHENNASLSLFSKAGFIQKTKNPDEMDLVYYQLTL